MTEHVVEHRLAFAVLPVVELVRERGAGGERSRDGRSGVLYLEHHLMRSAIVREPAAWPNLGDDQLGTVEAELGTMALTDLDGFDEAEHLRVPGDSGTR